ncbi:hypothetical protein DEJ44_07055 [Streptomyces venezuelae]|uniref:hypothetical protein n=1 Tax=Streptomyces venezuelae TaxID=54571 RepID=UPI00123BD208|nr:hypothetical protein [Streptomyces venezuelae]QES05397.1 hypothetical protein DEJ44_07055 [Streptomyces venezuelae]
MTRTEPRTGARAVPPGDLPGVRAQLRGVTADLAAGRNCLWLVTDAMVESGLADELYRGALFGTPVRVDVPPPPSPRARGPEPEREPATGEGDGWAAGDGGARADGDGGAWADGEGDGWETGEGDGWAAGDGGARADGEGGAWADGEGDGWADGDAGAWADGDDLPYLDLSDDGFDLDLGWSLDARAPRVPAPRTEQAGPRHDPHGLLARLAKELSVDADEAVATLVDPGRGRRPVVGVRAWTEPDDHDGGTSPGPGPGTGPGTGTRARGAAVERLFRLLAAAVKDAGLPPGERPRLLVVARLRDLPEPLPDELRHGLGDTAVHWWWGALGRLDTATAVAPILDHGPDTSGRDRDPLAERIRRAVRSETVVEICGPDLELARLLALEWDGAQHTLGAAVGRCLAAAPAPVPSACPPLRRIGALLRPGAELRQAWAAGAVVSWEGRLRAHVGVWHPAAPADGPQPAPDGDVRARLTALVSQAQQRVLAPWIEEARQRLAVRALGHLNRPVATLVADYADRPPAYLGGDPERAFLELQVGELLRAHVSGALALPPRDAALLRLLVTTRNVLAHRSVLYDRTLDELCGELSQADLRAA